MLNLLTEEAKRSIRKVYLTRLVVTCLFLTMFLLVFGVVALIPSYLASSVKEKTASERLAVIKETNNQILDESLQNEAQVLNNKVNILLADNLFTLTREAGQGFMRSVIGDKPEKISINSIFYDKKAGAATLRGTSKDRDSLLSFIKILEEKEGFSQVDLPISNLVKDADIEFTIKINLNDE